MKKLTLFVIILLYVPLAEAQNPSRDNDVSTTPAAAGEGSERKPRFRSAKAISSICEVDEAPPSFPGFKEAAGRQVAEMPPLFAQMMSIGADRPMVETDLERVAPGFTLISPFTEKNSFLIDNDREIVAVLENNHYPMLTEILPNGHRIVESNRYFYRFADAGGYTGCLEEYDEHGNLLWQLNLLLDFTIVPG